MKIKLLSSALLFILANNYVAAQQIDQAELKAKREHVIHQYIIDLGKADSEDITSLFAENGTVISTSQGKVGANQFFNNFLPQIHEAATVFHQLFISQENENHYTARFHFNFTLKDGEVGSGEYIDEFIFAAGSKKLTQVAMFENLKF